MEDSGIGRSLSQALGSIMDALPALIGALLILIIGYIIAKVLQGIVTRVLQSMGFQGWMERGGIKQFFDRSQTRQTPLSILGKLVFWLVFFIAISMAVDTLGITAISEVLAQFIAYIPQIIAAALILILATLLANFVAGIVRGATGSNVAGSIAQYGIIVFAAFAALTQLGIAEELIVPTFLILLGAVALAAALAFGLGGQGVAQRLVEQGYQKSGEARQQIQQRQQQNQQQQASSSESSYTRVDSGDTRRLR
ncbi:MAG: mechanosensitive ion channel [Actinomycetota bacterium]|nr:mechanosensitive ion channel [Actinomycetota bacterium]